MKINKVTFTELLKIAKNTEGLVLLGCGGSWIEWVDGITEMLHEEKAITSSKPSEIWGKIYATETTGGRTDLIMMFPETQSSTGPHIDISRLAIVRLQMHEQFSNSWLSDYIDNYAKDHDASK